MTRSQISIPYGRHEVTEDDIGGMVDVLRSAWLTQGPTINRFEAGIELYTSSSFAVTANSATSALHLACQAVGVTKGDIVWTSAITFVASANCARYCGAEVDFVDIEPDTGLMSLSRLEDKLKVSAQLGRLPKVIIPVHLAGASCDMKEISQLARKYGVYVIEDASHAIGGRYEGEPIGCCRYSDVCVFSFHPVKIITTVEGGVATTNDIELAKTMKRLRSHGIERDANYFQRESQGPWYYEQCELGYNYRLNDVQAALGISQLERLDSIVRTRNDLALVYREALCNMPVKMLEVGDCRLSSYHLAIIRLQEMSRDKHREVFEYMRDNGIGVQLHYLPVHLHPYYRHQGFKEGCFPESEKYAQDAITLPLYPGLTREEQQYVVSTLKSALT